MTSLQLAGSRLSALDSGTLGILFLVLGSLSVVALWYLLQSIRRAFARDNGRQRVKVTIERDETLDDEKIRVSADLVARGRWIQIGEPARVCSLRTDLELNFDELRRKNNASEATIFVNSEIAAKLAGNLGNEALIEFLNPAPVNIWSHVVAAGQSPARRSELIIGVWFVLFSLLAEAVIGLI
ncbi:hypothetical protein [Maricaulis maris]|jgi:hypothetical protein|uniref:hypothetical protein n=1 Tax=Maricaulis maris TaxID=74318 RepID=UPI00291CBB11|nr:hypothetical protein MACH15_05560 [Maricaulis maris]